MKIFNADLHIHSPHSIAVSKSLNLDTMLTTCRKKGLSILGTGDILQPDWLTYMKNNLEKDSDGAYKYKDVYFILQTEIEDIDSIHHVILFPGFAEVEEIQNELKSYSKNISDEWGGRPRVNLRAPELTDIITDNSGIIGPAHAFTPFKAIFRQNKYKTLEECYQDSTNKISFLELGLSANTDLADRLDCLKTVSFLSNSDAHSQDPRSLGREFNRFDIDNPTFEEIYLALKRKDERRIVLNVGLHPALGKYYNMFCSKCRRRVIFKSPKNPRTSFFNQYTITENFIIFISDDPQGAKNEYINKVADEKITCPACQEELNKKHKIKLGVHERISTIATQNDGIHPVHRPPYINAIPLIDIIRSVKGIKSSHSKTVLKVYDKMIEDFGTEFEILIDTPIEILRKNYNEIASVIEAFRNGEIEYTPGGGGTYGQIKIDV